ncbi:MAG: hypothetical protein ACYC5N_11365 [Endomicrobiales bacterium]
MVKEIKANGTRLFQCGECGLKYRRREWAEKCEQWCGKHKSCHLELIKHAVPGRKR